VAPLRTPDAYPSRRSANPCAALAQAHILPKLFLSLSLCWVESVYRHRRLALTAGSKDEPMTLSVVVEADYFAFSCSGNEPGRVHVNCSPR
jgi:hypothetical protein